MLNTEERESLVSSLEKTLGCSLSTLAELLQPYNTTPQNGSDSTFAQVTQLIGKLGIPANLLGYQYIRQSILLAIDNPEVLQQITSVLYPEVARKFNTTAQRVERNIRHAIEIAWKRTDIESLSEVFGSTVSPDKGKPTNSELISMCADYLQLQTH